MQLDHWRMKYSVASVVSCALLSCLITFSLADASDLIKASNCITIDASQKKDIENSIEQINTGKSVTSALSDKDQQFKTLTLLGLYAVSKFNDNEFKRKFGEENYSLIQDSPSFIAINYASLKKRKYREKFSKILNSGKLSCLYNKNNKIIESAIHRLSTYDQESGEFILNRNLDYLRSSGQINKNNFREYMFRLHHLGDAVFSKEVLYWRNIDSSICKDLSLKDDCAEQIEKLVTDRRNEVTKASSVEIVCNFAAQVGDKLFKVDMCN